jgi:hypothetical protein
MRTLKSISMLLIIALAVLAVPSIGKAADGSIKATLNFDKVFEVPGMVFAPGTYIFKTISGDKETVQIWNANETELYTTLFTRSEHLATPAARTIAVLDGNSGDTRRAVKSFQVRNSDTQEEFVYSSSEPRSR